MVTDIPSAKRKQFLRKRLFLAALLLCMLGEHSRARQQQGPDPLSYAEIAGLSERYASDPALRDKVIRLLSVPFVDNGASARGVKPLKPDVPRLGRSMRVVLWNIERGINYEAIEAALGNAEKLAPMLDEAKYPPGSKRRAEILNQVERLEQADVIVLNEVDWGMPRTDYRNVIKDLASALNMNYAYGVEFIYTKPVGVGDEPIDEDPSDDSDTAALDPARYRGLHGNAILSRYPLENVRLLALPTTDTAPQTERRAEESLIITSVRFGRRIALLADITDPDIPTGKVIVISTHLEAHARPRVRWRQFETLLSLIKDTRHPVILAGDMNTVALDTTPTSALGLIKRRAASKSQWATRALSYVTGMGLLLESVLAVIRFNRTMPDPTVVHIPVIAPNPADEYFDRLKEFRFADGGAFDFRGDRNRSTGRHTQTLANSNERGGRGFITTFELPSTFWGLGEFKLDWVFVKPPGLTQPFDRRQPYRFAPHFGTTFKDLNYSLPKRISDHDPMMVDLPFGEPSSLRPPD